MRNVDFTLGFPLEREALNDLMNSDEYCDRIKMAHYESTSNTSVNIKMFSPEPKDLKYVRLVVPIPKRDAKGVIISSLREAYFDETTKKRYDGVVERKKPSLITFIVFSSSETILSGRYEEKMRECYDFFLEVVKANRSILEERINRLDSKAIQNLLRDVLV